MENKINGVFDIIGSVIKNSHFDINISGWPAALSVATVCASGVILYSIKNKPMQEQKR